MTKGRTIENLNLNWKFHRGDEPTAWYKGADDSSWRDVTLPHDWSVEEPFSQEHSSGTGYLPGGVGWYRKHINLPGDVQGKKVYITFEGVYNNAQVWCNSYYLGKRPFGYSTFTYDISDFLVYGEIGNVISVKVDHKDIADSRWFTGSGIYRDVQLSITDPVHLDRYGVFVTTPSVIDDKAVISVNVRLINETGEMAELQIVNSLYDTEGALISSTSDERTVLGGTGLELDQIIDVSSPHLWSPDNPYLYTMVTEIRRNGEVVDDQRTSVGIRTFVFDADKGFYLNDIAMKIKGVCVHHDAGCLGAAVSVQVWERRLRELKEMGCNAIRMSHNPPSPNLLDLCDQMGFLVVDEAFDEWEGVKNKWSTGHNVYPPKHFGYYEDFPQWGELDLKEMVLRDRNHASIILWSIGNEVDYPNDPYCHPYFQNMTGNNDANKPATERQYDPNKPNSERLTTIARKLVGYVKECDTTRPVTAALAFPELSNLTGYAATLDVVGYNYKEHLYEEGHRAYPGKVIYGSENGSSLQQWLAVRDNDYISAQFIWTGIDYMGEAKGWPVRAAQAGFLDLAGFRKPAYYFRQSLWSPEPMVFLSAMRKGDPQEERSGRWSGGNPHWNWKAGERLDIVCCTNCVEAELFLNDRSLGVRRLEESGLGYLTWETAFEEGKLKVVAKDADGNLHMCTLQTSAPAAKLAMSVDTLTLKADGQDMAHIEIRVMDDGGQLVYVSDHPIRLTIEGPGEIMGLENGDVTDLEPYCSKERRAYHGRLLGYIRAQTSAGEIVVTAEADGLGSAKVTIQVG